MKAGMKTVLRTAAWSTSALLLVGAAAGTASAVTSHKNHASTTGTSSNAASTSSAQSRPKMLHDIATVENGDGSFEQYASQLGTVSAVGATSITVVSDDAYSATYAVDSDTKVFKNGKQAAIGDVAKGDTVFVHAEAEDGSFTAQVIGDGKPPAGHRPPGGPGGPGAPGGPGGPGGPGAPGGPAAPGGDGDGS